MSRRKKHNRSAYQFLAQVLVRWTGAQSTPCQAGVHQQTETPAIAEWALHMYQDVEMLLTLLSQGLPEAQINQRVWDAACHEQDTIGVVNHKTMHLCSACTHHIVSNRVGEDQSTLSMITATVTGSSFLLVSDRITENTAIIGNIGPDIQEEDLLERIEHGQKVDIRLNERVNP